MKTRLPHPIYLPAILTCIAVALIAAFTFLRPVAPPPDPPAEIEEAASPGRPALRHRLADAGWRLVETTERGEDRRILQPVALIGGEEIETPPWYALVEAIYPASAETRRQFPDLPPDAEERGNCGGKHYLLDGAAFVETAAHCVIARDGSTPKRIEVCIQPYQRSLCRDRFEIHRAAIDANYEADWAAGLRDDRAVMPLPDDPGGGGRLPQTPRVQMEPGEILHVFAMGRDATGALADQLKTCPQIVIDVRPGLITTQATPDCAVQGADSGSPGGRLIEREDGSFEFIHTVTVSSMDGERNHYAPIRPDKTRTAAGAFHGGS